MVSEGTPQPLITVWARSEAIRLAFDAYREHSRALQARRAATASQAPVPSGAGSQGPVRQSAWRGASTTGQGDVTVTTTIEPQQAEETRTRLVSLDLTRKCQLACTHCYNGSGTDGTHGTMTREDWARVLDEATAYGVSTVQFIGGEPTMHPDLTHLTEHALLLGMTVEVFTNLVHISPEHWALFALPGVSLGTSYYSAAAGKHDAVTGRASHRRTRANIEQAINRGLSLRVGIITEEGDDGAAARADLESLGVSRIKIDHMRAFGRAAEPEVAPCMGDLCGKCGTSQAAIAPDGTVSPCVMSGWVGVGNVKADTFSSIVGGAVMGRAKLDIRAATGFSPLCASTDDDECSPGTPGSDCSPRR